MLSAADVDRIAEAVCDRMGGSLPQLLTADQVAERLSVDRDWVYENADDLGAIRIGNGSKPRLRFDAAKVLSFLSAGSGSQSSQTVEPASRPALKRRRKSSRRPVPAAVPDRGARRG